MPDGWTPADGLVIWNHGFGLDMEPDVDLGPLADLQLLEGYAVAASSFRLIGWALFETVSDNRELVDAFEKAFGVPQQIFVYGGSLGGLVTAQAIEIGGLGNVVGAMSICGAVAGSRIWDGALDLRLIYDAVCGNVPGAAIPGGAEGLPDPPDPSVNMVLAVEACTGILQLPEQRTPEQVARLARILAVTGLPENFLLTDMGYATSGLSDLVHDPQKLDGGMGLGNANVDYGDADLNATIERVQADPDLRRRMVDNYTPSGRVGDVKIISLQTDQDGLVLVEGLSAYASVVPAENLTLGIVVEDVPTHCGFTTAEILASWEALRGWVAGLPQPTAQNLQDTCNGLAVGGVAEGPCRIDPGFVVPDLDDRMRPRDVCVPDATTLCLGDKGRFQLRITWEDFAGNTGPGRTTGMGTQDTGSFWFFDSDNIELVVKVLDGRQLNGHHWVFYGSLTNVGFELTVTDMETSLQKVYSNPSGNFASVGDNTAF
ncbi:MAG: hypothetical protein GY856_25680 [bacterium]|nr:hypothetical protein [bacterium]